MLERLTRLFSRSPREAATQPEVNRAEIIRAVHDSFGWLQIETSDARARYEQGEARDGFIYCDLWNMVDYYDLVPFMQTAEDGTTQLDSERIVFVELQDGTKIGQGLPVEGLMRINQRIIVQSWYAAGSKKIEPPDFYRVRDQLIEDNKLLERASQPWRTCYPAWAVQEGLKAVEASRISQDLLQAHRGQYAEDNNWLAACRKLEERRLLLSLPAARAI